MGIKSIFEILKADRYTADGCDKIAKVQDKVYQIGEISQKTGLQKTAEGWKPPKSNASKQLAKELDVEGRELERRNKKKADADAKREERWKQERREGEANADAFRKKVESGEIVYNKETGQFEDRKQKSNASKSSLGGEAESQSLRAAAKAVGEVNKAKTIKQKTEILEEYGWNSDDGGQTWTNTINGVNQKIKADMQTGEFKLVKPAGAEKKPDGADRHDQIGGEIKGNLEAAKYYFDKAQSFSTTDPSYKTYMGKAKEYNDKAKAQADDYGFDFEEMHNAGVTNAVNQYANGQDKPAESKSSYWIQDPNGNRMTNGDAKQRIETNRKEIERLKTSGEPRADMKIRELKNMNEHLIERLDPKDRPTESKPSAPAQPKPSMQEYMKAKDRVKKYEEQYKKEMDDYEYMERIKANGVDPSIFNPMYGGKPKPLSENKSYMEELNKVKAFEAEDAAYTAQTVNAPREKLERTLTGDTKIKVKK